MSTSIGGQLKLSDAHFPVDARTYVVPCIQPFTTFVTRFSNGEIEWINLAPLRAGLCRQVLYAQ